MIGSGLEYVIDFVAIGSTCATIMVAVCAYYNSRKKARVETLMEVFSNYLYFSSLVNSNITQIEKYSKMAADGDNVTKSNLAIMGKNHILDPRIFETLDKFEIKAIAFCQANSTTTHSILDEVTMLRIWLQNVNALYGLLANGKTEDYLKLYENCIYCGQNGEKYQFITGSFYDHMMRELKRLGLLKEKNDP